MLKIAQKIAAILLQSSVAGNEFTARMPKTARNTSLHLV